MDDTYAYMELADGIVEQACTDYVKSQLRLMGIIRNVKKDKEGKEIVTYKIYEREKMSNELITMHRRRIMDCVTFFESDWFNTLKPNLDYKDVLQALNDKVRRYVAEAKAQVENKRKTDKRKGSRWEKAMEL